MDIAKLAADYRQNAEAFYANVIDPRNKKKTHHHAVPPNYLAQVIIPVLRALVRRLPECRLNDPDESYIFQFGYFPVASGLSLFGGLSPDHNYNLTYTPLFKRKASGETVTINTLDELVACVVRDFKNRSIFKPDHEK